MTRRASISPALVEAVQFLEDKWVIVREGEARSDEKLLSWFLSEGVKDYCRELLRSPTVHPYYRGLRNRHCEEMGFSDKKEKDPDPMEWLTSFCEDDSR